MASHARKKAYELVTTGSPEHSGIPCATALRLTPCSLRRSGSLSPSQVTMRQHRHRLRASVEALRPHGFVVRGNALVSCTAGVHRIPQPNVRDDREAPLFDRGGTLESIMLRLANNEAKYFWRKGLREAQISRTASRTRTNVVLQNVRQRQAIEIRKPNPAPAGGDKARDRRCCFAAGLEPYLVSDS
jgi:hypothetical protein